MKPVLVLQHVPYEGQGYIADYLQDHDTKFDVLRLWQPYAVPDVSTYSALIVMGGPMGVYEDFPSRDDAVALIKAAIGHIPTLGICLGSQLIAHAVRRLTAGNISRVPKSGLRLQERLQPPVPLELTPEMVQGLAEANRHWTHESFDLDEAQLERDARDLAPLLRAQSYGLLDNFFS